METEIASDIENGTWVLTKLPHGRSKIIDRWVFKITYDPDDSILKYKARWMVHDYKQIAGIDFTSIWVGVFKSIQSSFLTTPPVYTLHWHVSAKGFRFRKSTC